MNFAAILVSSVIALGVLPQGLWGDAYDDQIHVRGRETRDHRAGIGEWAGAGPVDGHRAAANPPIRRPVPCDPFGFEGEFQPDPDFRCEYLYVGSVVPVPYRIERTDSEGETVEAPLVVSQEDFQTLPLEAGELNIQPDRGWVLVNIDTVVWSDAVEHTLTTSVLGVPVEVLATPATFSWDFGDGSPSVVSHGPGAPWPEATVSHSYRRAQQVAQVAVSIEWQGQFRPVGAQEWQAVTGTAVTTTAADPVDVVTVEPSLVTGGHRG